MKYSLGPSQDLNGFYIRGKPDRMKNVPPRQIKQIKQIMEHNPSLRADHHKTGSSQINSEKSLAKEKATCKLKSNNFLDKCDFNGLSVQ